MANLGDIKFWVEDQIAREDLADQVKKEISLAVQRYSRKLTYLTEVRAGALATVASTTWYGTVDLSSGASYSDLAARTEVAAKDIVKINYMRRANGDRMVPVSYADFERYGEGSQTDGTPWAYTISAGQIGIWPPASGVEELYFSAFVKPVVPTGVADLSVFFDEAEELIEASVAARMCRKYTHNYEKAGSFEALEALHYSDLLAENRTKMGSGRIRAHE